MLYIGYGRDSYHCPLGPDTVCSTRWLRGSVVNVLVKHKYGTWLFFILVALNPKATHQYLSQNILESL